VHLGDERTRGVDDLQVSNPRVRVDIGSDAVRRQDDDRALGNLGLGLDEHRPFGLEIFDDVQVVDDLLAHVHGGTVHEQSLLDRLDGTLDAGAVSARSGEEDLARHDPIVPAALGMLGV
jgi:hypothetical protein